MMEDKKAVTISYLQRYLKNKDFNPDNKTAYYLKLFEEMGELADALNHEKHAVSDTDFRGSIEEELWDVVYYALCIANLYDIDLEHWIAVKEAYNNARYNPDIVYAPDKT